VKQLTTITLLFVLGIFLAGIFIVYFTSFTESSDDVNSAQITYEPLTHTVNLTWDFGGEEKCLMRTSIESFYNVNGTATKVLPERFWFGDNLYTLTSNDMDDIITETIAEVDCKGEFSYNIGDLEYLDNFTGIDVWSTFYEVDDNEKEMLHQLNFGYDEVEVLSVIEDPCEDEGRAEYFTDYYYGSDGAFLREKNNTTGDGCNDVKQNFDNGVIPLEYTPVSSIIHVVEWSEK